MLPKPSRPWARWHPLAAASLISAALAVGTAGCGYWYLETRSAPTRAEQQAPAFTLPDHEGTPVSLASQLERGPAVVVFYRGHW